MFSFWNAGGLTNDKFTELKTIVLNNDLDVMGIKCGAAADNKEYFNLNDYQKFVLKRSRQIASGIIVFVKLSLKTKLIASRQMTTDDKLEFVQMHIWRQDTPIRVFFLYNPLNNKPDFDCILLNWDSKSLILGDFKAPSTRWGYMATSCIGSIVENLIDSNPIDFIENEENSPTFLSYSGGVSHPDLLLTHPALSDRVQNKLIDSPGGAGHKILLSSFIKYRPSYREPKRTYWNLKSANWAKFKNLTNEVLTDSLIMPNFEYSSRLFTLSALKCASFCIPREQQKKYNPFWDENLQKLKKDRDEARERESSQHWTV
ncbi:hypothetical protein TNCT_347801 [Trichonephila clavata]|uniref:Endonuclease/exonuclease/phosphatase domain-containing protein n=1 Tax=Trichonephila clavata TaxID=2740835 RepID=A0A8X6L6Z8_TRICU|nr:hypothetical protein TNCT_347801 [Trichonephila clavata]